MTYVLLLKVITLHINCKVKPDRFLFIPQDELERLNNASHQINLLEKDHEVSSE